MGRRAEGSAGRAGRAHRDPRRPGARSAPLSTAPAARRIPSPGLRLARRFPVSTSGASNPHGRPDPSSSRLGTPDLQRSTSSQPPDLLLESTLKAWTSIGGEESTSSQSPITVHRHPGWGPNGTPGRWRPIPSWDLLPSLQPSSAGSIGCPVRDLPEGSTPKSRDLPVPKSRFPLPTDPEPGQIHWVPASSPANFANFSPGASAEQKLGGHRRSPPPQPPRGPGTGTDGRPLNLSVKRQRWSG